MSSSEVNKAAVRDCFHTASRGEYDALRDIVSPAYVLHPEEAQGPEGLARMIEGYRSALADLRVSIEHQFTEGDWVATRSTVRGRHAGELMGAPPTGRDVSFSVLTISRCRDGRIEEEWELADTMALLQQVGALPALAGA
jgi:predicted ester cyclase